MFNHSNKTVTVFRSEQQCSKLCRYILRILCPLSVMLVEISYSQPGVTHFLIFTLLISNHAVTKNSGAALGLFDNIHPHKTVSHDRHQMQNHA